MQLLYSFEHVSCSSYDNKGKSVIEVITLLKGQQFELSTEVNLFNFIIKGKLHFFCEGRKGKQKIKEGEFTLFMSDTKVLLEAREDTEIMIIRLYRDIQLCEVYSLERLFREVGNEDEKEVRQNILKINGRIGGYLNTLKQYVKDGLKCTHFFDIKISEFFYLLRAYYTKEDLCILFYPLFSNDISFSNFIFRNYKKVKNVKELAKICNYSVSGLEKRFKKVFNTTPSQWLNSQKAKNVYHIINNSTKTFKEISLESGFASPAHLNDFCKSQFGLTPGGIRKENKLAN